MVIAILALTLCTGAWADRGGRPPGLPHTLAHRWLSAARGGAVRAPGGIELRVAAHVMRRDGRASITEIDSGVYAIHIAVPWRGAVTVVLPLSQGLPIVAHRVSGEWRIERARAIGGRAVARVHALSLFGDLAKCIKPESFHGLLICLLKAGVRELPHTIFKTIVNKIIPTYDPCRPINFSLDLTDLLAACPAVNGPAPTQHPSTPSPTQSPAPSPPSGSATSPQPAQPQPSQPQPIPPGESTSYTHHVYGTCADKVCGLKIRSGPGYSAYAQVGSLADGDTVQVICQAIGELVGPSPATGNSSAIWDQLVSGGWVSDLYIDTPGVGTFSPPIPQC